MKDRGRTKYSILGMLSFEDLTGYQIIKMIKNCIGPFWSESEGQIYPALAQCVKDGFVTFKEEISNKVKRIKKVYSITPKGKKALKEWLNKEPQTTTVRNELLLKVFFGNNANNKDIVHHVTHRQKQIETQLKLYKKAKDDLPSSLKNSPHFKFWTATLNCGIKASQAEIAWCKETLTILGED